MHSTFAFLDFLGPSGILIVGVIAILLFGERLPEVARSFGKQFMEFKRSVQGIREEFESVARDAVSTVERTVSTTTEERVDREEATAPKFEPPPSEPVAESSARS
jgi:sec-independent protein translocase protein TatA